ncbi:MAG TPA: cytochrome c oxidase subunit II transmembrane domain-containing protein, partial [Parvularculaceae bacterium]|nr:cytochrome c oxidase subunit II transmembrane domain-containing protein [Parvularculaceae bacterium]
MRKLIAGSAVAGLAAAIASLGVAGAEDGYRPVDGGFEMLAAGSKLAEEVHFFHNIILMPIITVISLFVLALLLYVMARYNSKANPTPRKFSHNTLVEIVWTGVPILILVSIALPS